MSRVLTTSFSVLILTFVIISTRAVDAQEFSSSNFRSNNPAIDMYSGLGTSTGFSSLLTGGQSLTGESTSTNFVLHMGFMYFDSFAPKSQNWRWYDDADSETPVTALAPENTAPTNIDNGNEIKLRIAVIDTADIGSSNVKLRLQYSTSSDFSSGGYVIAESNACVGGSTWCYADGVDTDGAIITTKVLTDSDACAGSVGNGCGTHNESGTSFSTFTHIRSAIVEYEFTITPSGAAPNTVFFFRPVDVASSTTVPLNTGETHPSLVTGGSSLEFTINGISAGIGTEGETTDITTTSTSIPFGTLGIGTPKAAAQRLTVSTNGTQGYKIYTYERQQLLSEGGSTIDPVTGTNASPLGWATGCSALADGCYGYHSGEDVLDGGSTRFAADDTFAQFSSSPHEIAFNNGPIENKSTDILYRILARDEQESGSYSANIVYIVTPVF